MLLSIIRKFFITAPGFVEKNNSKNVTSLLIKGNPIANTEKMTCPVLRILSCGCCMVWVLENSY